MLKKSMVVSFMISMLLIMSCSDDPTSSDPVTAYRMVERNNYEYEPATSTWIPSSEWNLDYDVYGRIELDYGIDFYDGDQYQDSISYDNTSTVLPKEFISYDDGKEMVMNSRSVYTYENGKAKEVLQYFYFGGVVVASQKTVVTYENNLLTSVIRYDDNDGIWEMTWEKTWTYTSGLLTEYTNFYTDGYGNKSTYTYSNGVLSEIIEYDWNVVGWELYDKSVYTYEDGKLKEVMDYDYYNSDWNIGDKTIYLYTNGYLSSETTSSWNDYEQVWKDRWKTGFEYDENWNIIAYVSYNWDEVTSEIVPSFKSEFIYEKAHGNYRDIMKVKYPEFFYTGLMIYSFDTLPSKAIENDRWLFKFLKRKDK